MTTTENTGTTPNEPTSQQPKAGADAATEQASAATTTTDKPVAGESAESTETTPAKDTLLSGDEGDKAGEGGATKPEVPETYVYTPPEGAELTDEIKTALASFDGKARELGLTQDQYQALVDFEVERGGDALAAQDRAYAERVEGWADAVRTDKELGGTQSEVAEKLSISKRALDHFATPELRSLVSFPSEQNPHGLGLGNHPEFVRLMYRIGQQLGDSKLVEGETGQPASQDAALRKMYPTMFADTA